MVTEVFALRSAVMALATSPAQPWDANAVAGLKSLHIRSDLRNPRCILSILMLWSKRGADGLRAPQKRICAFD